MGKKGTQEGSPGTPPGGVSTAKQSWQGHAWLVGWLVLGHLGFSLLPSFLPSPHLPSRTGFAKQLGYLVLYQLVPALISDLPLHLDASY